MRSFLFKKIKNNSFFYEHIEMHAINLINPYLNKTNIDLEIFSLVNTTEIITSVIDILYQSSKKLHNINKKNKIKLQNLELKYTTIQYDNLDKTQLNQYEIELYNYYVICINNKLLTIEKIFNIFLNIYMNASTIKLDHLSNIIGKDIKRNKSRKNSSECDLKNFLDDYKIKKSTIIDEYNCILKEHNLSNRINNKNNAWPQVCFCLNKIYFLFKKYIQSLKYYLKLLEIKTYVIRYNELFIFDDTEYIKLYDNDEIHIYHMNTFLNCKKWLNKIDVENCNKIILKKTTKRNVIYFDKN